MEVVHSPLPEHKFAAMASLACTEAHIFRPFVERLLAQPVYFAGYARDENGPIVLISFNRSDPREPESRRIVPLFCSRELLLSHFEDTTDPEMIAFSTDGQSILEAIARINEPREVEIYHTPEHPPLILSSEIVRELSGITNHRLTEIDSGDLEIPLDPALNNTSTRSELAQILEQYGISRACLSLYSAAEPDSLMLILIGGEQKKRQLLLEALNIFVHSQKIRCSSWHLAFFGPDQLEDFEKLKDYCINIPIKSWK